MDTPREFTLDDFYFDLPDELIAQHPLSERDSSRLLVLHRNPFKLEHRMFRDIVRFFSPGDLLVFNNTRVIPARSHFLKDTGALIEIIFTEKINERDWLIITNRTRRLRTGDKLVSAKSPSVILEVTGRDDDRVRVRSNIPLTGDSLNAIGEVPLPPYIKRKTTENDIDRYQTIYAMKDGSAAAPTAGLHFSEDVFRDMSERRIYSVYVTLHVSLGTFQPVRTERISDHKMHREHYTLDNETAVTINEKRKNGNIITAVGTTSLRVMESTFSNGKNIPGEGSTDIFIYPPREITSVDSMVTNFHTPGSTLLMLISAFAGHDAVMAAYREAVKEKYRFFSYGDAMLII